MKKLFIILFSIVILAGIGSCKKDPTSPASETYKAPTIQLETTYQDGSIKVNTEEELTITTKNNVKYDVEITAEYIKDSSISLQEGEEVGNIVLNSDTTKTFHKSDYIKTLSLTDLEGEVVNNIKLNIKKQGDLEIEIKVSNASKTTTENETIIIEENLKPVISINETIDDEQYPYKVTFDLSGSYDEDGSIEHYYAKIDQVNNSSKSKNNGYDLTGYTEVSETFIRYYENAGQYEISIVAIDNLGGENEKTKGFMVSNSIPTAVIDVASTTKPAPATFDLSGSKSSDQEDDITSYEWDFGDGTTGTGVNISHTYETPGNYEVQLKVYDSNNEYGTDNVTLTVSENTNSPIINYTKLAGESVSPSNTIDIYVNESNTLSVSASDENGINKLEFYKDGTLAGSETFSNNPVDITKQYQVTFSETGSKSLTIKIYDTFDNCAERTGSINVLPKEPNAELNMVSPDNQDNPLYISYHPETVEFNAVGSDLNGAGGDLEFEYYYREGQTSSTDISTYTQISARLDKATTTVSHTLENPGMHTILLRVINTGYSETLESFAIRHVNLANNGPVINNLSVDGSDIIENSELLRHPYDTPSISISAVDPDHIDGGATDLILYRATIDGTVVKDWGSQSSFQLNTNYDRLQAGTDGSQVSHSITIYVKDEYQDTYSEKFQFVINSKDNKPIINTGGAEFTYSDPTVVAGVTECTITVSSANDQDINDEIKKYKYDWGDGTVSSWTNDNTATHVYPTAGSFTPRVKVKSGFTGNYLYTLESDYYTLATVEISENNPPVIVTDPEDNYCYSVEIDRTKDIHPPEAINMKYKITDPDLQDSNLDTWIKIYDDTDTCIYTSNTTEVGDGNPNERTINAQTDIDLSETYVSTLTVRLYASDGKTNVYEDKIITIGNNAPELSNINTVYNYVLSKQEANIYGTGTNIGSEKIKYNITISANIIDNDSMTDLINADYVLECNDGTNINTVSGTIGEDGVIENTNGVEIYTSSWSNTLKYKDRIEGSYSNTINIPVENYVILGSITKTIDSQGSVWRNGEEVQFKNYKVDLNWVNNTDKTITRTTIYNEDGTIFNQQDQQINQFYYMWYEDGSGDQIGRIKADIIENSQIIYSADIDVTGEPFIP